MQTKRRAQQVVISKLGANTYVPQTPLHRRFVPPTTSIDEDIAPNEESMVVITVYL
jgi:hypothetical protein